MSLSLVATCALGLEELLAGELTNLGLNKVERQKGAVAFHGSWREVWRANYRLRTANRVLVELGSWPARDGDELAAGAMALVRGQGRVAGRGAEARGEDVRASWDGVEGRALFDPDASLAVRATASGSRITDARWVALKVKDGIVDAQRSLWGRRSFIERQQPERALRVWLHDDHATLLLDTSGEPLDRRGYRVESGAAPVREQIAAACVLAAGWESGGPGASSGDAAVVEPPVIDPMCGTGTLLAEAGWIGLGWAPGRLRREWAFERLPSFDPRAWAKVRGEPWLAPFPGLRLQGVDESGDALRAARANLEAAGLGTRARLEKGDAFAYHPPAGPGLLLVNPPYGARLAAGEEEWRRLGDLLKQRYAGYRAVVLAGDASRGKWIGLKPRRRIPVILGAIEARILVFDLY